ncbi:MAG: FKBP-type peptidyl-prolyl cis-trans isomerase [Bacteroidales bacterium]|nr:FKBP-type peptidyl-prolyl cis-trans isomerase [Bacteroidales bacterium]
MQIKSILFTTALAALMAACGEPPVVDVQQQQGDPLKENMINANKYFASSEENEIDSYIGRRGWKMQKLNNGTRLWEYQKGNGKELQNEECVNVEYRLETLTGKVLYEKAEDMVIMGRGQAIAGLETALKSLTHGSKAKVIIPSAMAYGVVGDGDQISTRMVLVLDLTVK